MKYVKKRGAPHDYVAWRKKVKGTQDEHYETGLRNPLKAQLHQALINEQGFLCAYTMKRIEKETSHIEHIKPESLCRDELVGSDLDYENMVACFPREGMKSKYRYGAQARGDWWENDGAEFITPLEPICEKRFWFDLEGRIGSTAGHTAAAKTIEMLGLAHASLTEDRERVITEFIFGAGGDDPLHAIKAQRAFQTICSRNKDGAFHEFCVAIRQALVQHLRNLEKLSKKRKFARKK